MVALVIANVEVTADVPVGSLCACDEYETIKKQEEVTNETLVFVVVSFLMC